MAKKSIPSATAVIVPNVPAPTAEVFQGVVVEHLPYAPETAPVGVAKPEIHVDQVIVDAFLHADGELKTAAVALFRACVAHSVSPLQFVGRSDAKVRASEFNCAHRVGMQFGHDNARRIIDAASEQAGDKRANVLSSLRKAKELGKQLRKAALKGAALTKALKSAGDEAVAFAEDEANFARKDKARGAQLPRIPKADSWAAYAPIAMAALGDMMKSLGSINLKPREIAAAKSLGELLDEAIDTIKGTLKD